MITKCSIEELTAELEAAQKERDRLKVVLRELLAIMPRATCENLPHDSLDVHPRSTHCWALQHFKDTVEVARGLVYVQAKEDEK
jgi:hypothetical protein